ncbi:MAG: rRNA small subunit methyltransferase 1, partial [Holosporales bacterium]|nr:rRNA small subunit methyltransferase 1 [Holosporales bacterium]
MSCHASPLWFQHLHAALPKLEAQNFPSGVYLVATPIGNLFDITLRALHVLEKANVVVAEDTRRTHLLLQAYGLSPVMMSYHDHNWEQSLQKIVDKVQEGQRVAVVSDAGTPLIADPGFRLVMQCRAKNIPVFALPGPSSVLAALTVAGMVPYPFHFFG